MALEIKVEYGINNQASVLRVTDKTGAYNVTTNAGGWGTPNLELDETAIWMAVKRKAAAGDEFFDVVGSAIAVDPIAANTKETSIEFVYRNDGVFEITIGVLRVSNDAIIYLDASGIQEGDYFYWNGSAYQMVSGVPEEIEDINDLVGNTDVVQDKCDDIILAKLAIEGQKLYKKYVIARKTKCENPDPLWLKFQKLIADIQGAVYTFASALPVEAQDQVENMLEDFNLNP